MESPLSKDELINELFNSPETITINGMPFFKCLLIKIPYFRILLENDNEIKLPEYMVDDNVLTLLKQRTFGFTINWKKFDIDTIIKSYDLSLYLAFHIIDKYEIRNLYIHLKNEEVIKLINATGILPYTPIYKIIVLEIMHPNLIKFNKAFCLQYGIGCEKDEKKAFELYKQNWEENKYSNSLHNLAYCYGNGIGCEEDEKLAFELYTKDWEENKNSGSLHNLAYCYHYGTGCEKDKNKAFEMCQYNWEKNKDSYSLDILRKYFNYGN